MAEKLTERFEMRLSEEGVVRLDAWRRAQPDIPSRAEAIRRLIDRGLVQERDGLWANCAEELYKMLVDLRKHDKINDATMDKADDIFGKSTGEYLSNIQDSRDVFSAPTPSISVPVEKSLIQQVKKSKSIEEINRVWESSFSTISSIGAQNIAFWHRIAGLFALRKAELQTDDESNFFNMLDPPGPSPRELEEQAEIEKRGGAGWIAHEGMLAGLLGEAVDCSDYATPMARELWLKGFIKGQNTRLTVSADELAERVAELKSHLHRGDNSQGT